jgi:hypothetical protein
MRVDRETQAARAEDRRRDAEPGAAYDEALAYHTDDDDLADALDL